LRLSTDSERLGGSAAFGAFHGSEPVGLAGLFIHEGQKEAHKGLLVGMYVRPSARKSGVGRRLVETIIEFARHRVELVQLSVVGENEQARRLRSVWASWNMVSK
jgi:GNAT superfamily N-acetyltransferase